MTLQVMDLLIYLLCMPRILIIVHPQHVTAHVWFVLSYFISGFTENQIDTITGWINSLLFFRKLEGHKEDSFVKCS